MNYETAAFLDIHLDAVLSDEVMRDIVCRIEYGIDPTDPPLGEDGIMYAISCAYDVLGSHVERFLTDGARKADRAFLQNDDPFLRAALSRVNPYDAVHIPYVVDALVEEIRVEIGENHHIVGLRVTRENRQTHPVAALAAVA
jgi:hypothetical protein